MKRNNSYIYERIGFKGMLNVIWNSIPFYAKFSLPYGLFVYKDFLSKSSSLEDLLNYHTDKYLNSKIFRIFRPRYRKIREILKSCYEIR